MAVTVEDVAKHLGFSTSPADPEAMQRCLDSAVAVIGPHIIVADYEDNPAYELAVLTLSAEFWRQKDAPRGVYGFADGSDTYLMGNMPRNVLPAIWPTLVNAGLVTPVVVA